MILAGVFGAVVGLALGLLGAGGSILAVPALVYGVGQPLHTAIPTSLAVVAVSSLGGIASRARRVHVRWRIALVFGAAGVPAAFAGSALGRLMPQRWLLLAFSVLMVAVAVRMLRGEENHDGACRTGEGGINWRRCLPKALGAGAAVGVLTGLFGVGGGFVIVPVLSALLGLGAQSAVATSLVVVLINSLAALGAHATAGPRLDYTILMIFAGVALMVSVLAGWLAPRLSATTLRRWFSYVVLAVAVGVALAAILNPAALG
ncbi:sulfite exporter TauE/SafE family protein [Saccharomonospora saliphila]|uniref:sulfite exporter TauE/SafE family protein n=1 Tax=Saccharomonospora saliphila TaxID=369829 RepID=UPI00036B30BF|nr:sulfite exporter TauE/SafE family protein [Saccharomonospora saliphila]